MAKKTGIILTSKGLEIALDPAAMRAELRTQVRRATELNGKIAAAAARKVLQGGVTPKNAALTQAIKGSDKPLVDSAELFGAISSEVVNDYEVFVGVARNAAGYNIALITHDGVTIQVTDKMRGMFYYLWQASIGAMDPSKLTGRAAELFERYQDWKPLKDSTTAIVIPPRRWTEQVFNDPELKARIERNWNDAIQRMFTARAKAGRAAPGGSLKGGK